MSSPLIRIDTSGIDAFCKEALLAMDRLDREVSDIFYAWTVRICTDIVQQSPQWSGDLASNWNYSVNVVDYTYTMSPNKADGDYRNGAVQKKSHGTGRYIFQRGDSPAVAMSLARMAAAPRPTWRDTVFFANATPIAPEVEAHSIKIRPVNLIQGQVAMISYTVTKESQSGRIL